MSGFDVDAMIAAGRADAPSAGQRAALRLGLQKKIAGAAWHRPAALAGGAAVLIAAALLVRLLGSAPAPAPAPVPLLLPAPVAFVPPLRVEVKPPPRPHHRAPLTPALSPTRGEGVVGSSSSLAEEARLLRLAQLGLDRADAAAARAPLDEHARRFPSGILAPERHAALALTACLDGQPELARREADALVALAPQSPLLARLKSSCAFAHEDSDGRPLTAPP
jgi:hypothetical protein